MDENWEYWIQNAKDYDRNNVKGNDDLYDQIENLLGRYLEKDMDVLELASGSGNLAKVFASSVHSWIGIDYSDEMVEEAASMNIPNASFETGDVQDIRFENESFDTVVFINALQVIPSPEKALMEANRVLRNGGMLLCSTFVNDELMSEVNKNSNDIKEFMTYHIWDKKYLHKLVENCGFALIDSELACTENEVMCFIVCSR